MSTRSEANTVLQDHIMAAVAYLLSELPEADQGYIMLSIPKDLSSGGNILSNIPAANIPQVFRAWAEQVETGHIDAISYRLN